MRSFVWCLVGGLSALLASSPQALAEASRPWTSQRVQLGAALEYGSFAGPTDMFADPYGLGLGLELGYTFSSALYLGLTLEHGFGESLDVSAAGLSGKASSWLMRLNAGIDIGLGERALVRPALGVGVALPDWETCNHVLDYCASGLNANVVLSAALSTSYDFGPVYVGLEGRFDVVLGRDDGYGLSFALNVGKAF